MLHSFLTHLFYLRSSFNMKGFLLSVLVSTPSLSSVWFQIKDIQAKCKSKVTLVKDVVTKALAEVQQCISVHVVLVNLTKTHDKVRPFENLVMPFFHSLQFDNFQANFCGSSRTVRQSSYIYKSSSFEEFVPVSFPGHAD